MGDGKIKGKSKKKEIVEEKMGKNRKKGERKKFFAIYKRKN